MKTELYLFKESFSQTERVLLCNDEFTVLSFKYESGIEAIKISNQKGFIVVLPFYGQIIWDVEFNNHSLKKENINCVS